MATIIKIRPAMSTDDAVDVLLGSVLRLWEYSHSIKERAKSSSSLLTGSLELSAQNKGN